LVKWFNVWTFTVCYRVQFFMGVFFIVVQFTTTYIISIDVGCEEAEWCVWFINKCGWITCIAWFSMYCVLLKLESQWEVCWLELTSSDFCWSSSLILMSASAYKLVRHIFNSSPHCTPHLKYTASFLSSCCDNELKIKALHMPEVLSSSFWRKGDSFVNLVPPCCPACSWGGNGSRCAWSSTEMTPKEYEQSIYIKYCIQSNSEFS